MPHPTRPRRKRGYHRPVYAVPCEVYSRIVGYLRPVQNWNEAKQLEFEQRQVYDMQQSTTRRARPPTATGRKVHPSAFVPARK
jgi:hypothetical protein